MRYVTFQYQLNLGAGSVIMLIAWRVSMYAFEGRILILHCSYFYRSTISGKTHKSCEGRRGGGLQSEYGAKTSRK
jgi:hypothetical protein